MVKKITVGFWSTDHLCLQESYECDSFLKLLLFLLLYFDRKDEGFYSISFFVGDKK